TNIFLKGYQWPFDAQRITDHQSSLIDMAVHVETVVRGRRVWMDFLRNPAGPRGWGAFRLDALGAEALDYLRATGAMQKTPLERLRHMNPPAIEIYAENGIDLAREPLEIAVCAQHQNGGFCVDKWWRSNLAGTFVIGEMAGTHGVKRPGGSALNAGQVGAMRAAEYIACAAPAAAPAPAATRAAVREGVAALLAEPVFMQARAARGKSAARPTPAEAMDEIRVRMTRCGAHLRSQSAARKALDDALRQYRDLHENGMKLPTPKALRDAVGTLQQCLTHVAMLKAICGLFERGAGSRGSHCILADDGIEMHPKLLDPETGKPYRFRPENESLRNSILCVRYDERAADLFALRDEAPRPVPNRQIAFEPAWTEYREGTIFSV
ncbi:MAG TPA: oxidoreductase, partial [Phycisphaerae bacterium]|nr:oxidoreductase [Phycisphaerae bacterium]